MNRFSTQIWLHLSGSWKHVGKQNVNKPYFLTTRHSLRVQPCTVHSNSSVIQLLAQRWSLTLVTYHFAGEYKILNPSHWCLNIPLDQTHPFLKGFLFRITFTCTHRHTLLHISCINMYYSVSKLCSHTAGEIKLFQKNDDRKNNFLLILFHLFIQATQL